MRWAMELGDERLGLRRLRWSAWVNNTPSMAWGKTMGFKEEGVMRYTSIVSSGFEGNGSKLVPSHTTTAADSVRFRRG